MITYFLISLLFAQDVNRQESLILVKRKEIVLYRSASDIEPYSKSFLYEPFFCRAGTGEVFLVERNKDGKGVIYFFASNGELRKMVELNPCCAINTQGGPGNVAGIQSVFVNRNNEFGTYDTGYRLSFWDVYGNLQYTTILSPYQLKMYYYLKSLVFDRRVLASGIYFFNPIKAIGGTQAAIFDYENTNSDPKIFDLPGEACSLAFSKGAESYTRIQVASLSTGQYACNVNLLHGIYIVSEDGKMLSNETVPPHFRSLAYADSLSPKVVEDSLGRRSQEVEDWLCTWTHSYRAYEYGQGRLLVPRVLYPATYLDLYSYTNDSITYNGYATCPKPFLFADTSGIYLEETRNSEELIVGKYSLVDTSLLNSNMSKMEQEAMQVAEKVSGIRKVAPSNDEDCLKCSRKSKKYRGNRNNLRNLKLLSPDSTEYVLLDSLTNDEDHLILFMARMGLITSVATYIAQNYNYENPELDLTIVLTHPYPAELEESLRFLRLMQTDYRILANTDENRLKPFMKSPVSLLEISEDGRIEKSGQWPNFAMQSR